MSRFRTISPSAQAGISMIEILVAMAIGAIILTGVMQSLVTNQRNTAWSDDVAYIQENGRYAMEMLARDIRWAGYWGCAVNISSAGGGPTKFFNSLNGGQGSDWLRLEGVRGYEGKLDTFPAELTNLWQDNASYAGHTDFPSDAIVLRGADDSLDLTVAEHKCKSAQFKLSRNNPLSPGDLALVVSEDCMDVGLMQMTGPSSGGTNVEFVHGTGNGTPGNCTKTIRRVQGSFDCSDAPAQNDACENYDPGSSLMRFAAIGYYIGTSVADASQPALYRIQIAGMDGGGGGVTRTDEIATGVEDMQLLYGFDTDGDARANAYVRASAIDAAAGEWKQVVSVRVTLLFRGYGDTREGQAAVNYIGFPYAGPDKSYQGQSYNDTILRQQASKTIRLRNISAS